MSRGRWLACECPDAWIVPARGMGQGRGAHMRALAIKGSPHEGPSR
ncbi:hypothetical protein HMPREF1316_0693 [Olsenella profusa F0195]|uniref:Uncharacterized protein n=1 Tax=Olsenella profusa F0195 TaxID=1125712 RepID=U2SZA1_9ACTN|nr:hypothetical protein HMPREF1316_0693 [Olsenella profusa F0195]